MGFVPQPNLQVVSIEMLKIKEKIRKLNNPDTGLITQDMKEEICNNRGGMIYSKIHTYHT